MKQNPIIKASFILQKPTIVHYQLSNKHVIVTTIVRHQHSSEHLHKPIRFPFRWFDNGNHKPS